MSFLSLRYYGFFRCHDLTKSHCLSLWEATNFMLKCYCLLTIKGTLVPSRSNILTEVLLSSPCLVVPYGCPIVSHLYTQTPFSGPPALKCLTRVQHKTSMSAVGLSTTTALWQICAPPYISDQHFRTKASRSVKTKTQPTECKCN